MTDTTKPNPFEWPGQAEGRMIRFHTQSRPIVHQFWVKKGTSLSEADVLINPTRCHHEVEVEHHGGEVRISVPKQRVPVRIINMKTGDIFMTSRLRLKSEFLKTLLREGSEARARRLMCNKRKKQKRARTGRRRS